MTRPNALDAFMARKARIDAMLARLQALSEDHFGVDPGAVDWSHVGSLDGYAEHLRELCDQAFREGEYAR
ncbi:MAG: hypothetical protein VYD87_01745 [Pseudomonadota bacterium]|nr:hypothetical protein [Pseudomonadota bacterium]